jgi:hypothetical protein
MPVTPQITLTANLQSILAGAEAAGYLRITLCAIGPILPCVPGTSMLADGTIPQIIGPQAGSTPLSILLYGNDVITPAGTFYEIAVLDANKNAIQAGNYQFSGTETIDLSNAIPMVGPYGFPLNALAYLPCVLGANNHSFTAPGTVIAPAYNGVLLPEGQSTPTLSYTLDSTGTEITLNFDIDPSWERIDAFCAV